MYVYCKFSTNFLVAGQQTLQREVESFIISHTVRGLRAGHHTPYDGAVWGHIMAPVSVGLTCQSVSVMDLSVAVSSVWMDQTQMSVSVSYM